jgi:hypothetical protein
MKKCILAGAAMLALSFTTSLEALTMSSDFSNNPLTGGGWSYGVGSNANNQLTWTGSSLQVHVDSSKPTVRLDLPIGTTLTTGTDFTLTCKFSFSVMSAPSNQSMQFAFGMVNHTVTGGNRTGLPSDPPYPAFGSSNVFSTVEFNYFPNVSPTYGGPTLTPSVFGAQSGGGDAFNNFTSVFGPGSDLGDNTGSAITALPQTTLLLATLAYTASTKMLALTMQQVNGDSSLTTLQTDVPALDLSFVNPTFAVDSLAIMSYADGFTSTSAPSLVGDMDIRQIAVSTPAPEPATAVLLLSAGGVLALMGRRRA